MANTSIYRNIASTGNSDICTVSCWFKRGLLATEYALFGGWRSSTTRFQVRFKTDDTIDVEYGYSSTWYSLITNRVFRDPSAWMHLVLAIDSTQATPADREKLYINGVQETSFSTESYMPQNNDTLMTTSGDEMIVGGSNASSSAGSHQNWMKGEMSHFQFVDGAQLAPTEFGETDSTSGIWKIKTGAYATPGTNGFFLKMEDRTNLDLDSSSNALTFTTGGTLTATYDNPSNNFCTLNPIQMSDPSANYILSQGNNTLNVTSNDYMRQTGMTIHPTGLKGYFEFKNVADSNYQVQFQDVTVKLGKENYNDLASSEMYFLTWGDLKFSNGGSAGELTAAYFGSPGAAQGDIIGCAFDFTGSNRNVWFHRNGTYGNNGSGVGNPSTGAYPAFTSSLLLTTKEYEIIFAANSGTTCTTAFNFGNGYFGTTAISTEGTNASGIGSFEYDVPTGFTALSTKGLNE